MTYTVVLREEPEGGYTVLVPALPGCFSCGATQAEALAMARDAIECHIGALRDIGREAPVEGADTSVSLPHEELTGPISIHRVSLSPEALTLA